MTGRPTSAALRPGPPAAPLTNPKPDRPPALSPGTAERTAGLSGDPGWLRRPRSEHGCCADRDCPGPDDVDQLADSLATLADLLADRVADRVQVAAVARIPAELRPILRNGCQSVQLFPARASDHAVLRIEVTDAGVFVSIDANGNPAVAVLRLLFAEPGPPP